MGLLFPLCKGELWEKKRGTIVRKRRETRTTFHPCCSPTSYCVTCKKIYIKKIKACVCKANQVNM